MTLYVESNFVIEVALGQEESESAEQLVGMAETGDVELALPAFSLSEPFATVTKRERDREGLRKQFDRHLSQLSRSSPHQGDVSSLQPISDILGRIDKREDDLLSSTVERLLSLATIIELDLSAFQNAKLYRRRYGLSAPDAIVFAAVVRHLRDNTGREFHFFATRDKHFTDPGMIRELGAHRCTLLSHFSEAVDRLKHQHAAPEDKT